MTRYDTFHQPRNIQIQRISNEPSMFLLSNFMSTTERFSLMWTASNHPYNVHKYSETTNRHGSLVSWMPLTHQISKSLAQSVANIVLEEKGVNTVHEELQVVKYYVDGKFSLHHDEQERIVTVLYYLNGIAGTWFPLASGASTNEQEQQPSPQEIPQNKEEALEQAKGLTPGQDGILVASSSSSSNNQSNNVQQAPSSTIPIQPGDALVFYSYKNDIEETSPSQQSSIQQDWLAIHAGLPALQEKWIATHWFHNK